MSVEPFIRKPDTADPSGTIQRVTGLRPVPPPRSAAPVHAPADVPAPQHARGTAPGGQRATPYRPRPAGRGRPAHDPFTARRRQRPEWLVSYISAVVALDTIAAAAAVWLATAGALPGGALPLAAAVGAVVLWPALLLVLGGYAERRLGTGAAEYHRVALAGLVGAAVSGYAASFAPQLDRVVLLGLPGAALLTLAGRLLNRRRLHASRRRGLMCKDVVLVGRDIAVLDLFDRIRRDPTAGLKVVGACVPNPMRSSRLVELGIPVLGTLDQVPQVLDEVRADAALVASASETAGQYLRDLAWQLEGTNVELLAAPGVVEVAPQRLQVRPMLSVPLLQILEPTFRGHRRLLKSLTDRVLAGVLLLLGSPVLLVLAVLVKVTSPGPVFFRHRRIGKRGQGFDLLKFRSMVTDADSRTAALMELNEGNEVQFKMRKDPRITPVGGVLRRFSLDELPQLVNVLFGHMSLVGPRPHVTREVDQYGSDMHRRLLVKPGITGLWQVSGRSDLSWAEAVELDIRYVENWSIGLDLAIVWRTVRAVLNSAGAY